MRRIAVLIVMSASAVAWALPAQPTPRPAAGGRKLSNTVKPKLAAGKQVVGIAITSPDPNVYCAAMNAGYDYTWIEMQHRPLTFGDVAKTICAGRGASAMPFIRVPDATQGDIQKAMIPMGARVNLGVAPGGRGQEGRGGVSPVEGQEK
jgi:hypothetical protein